MTLSRPHLFLLAAVSISACGGPPSEDTSDAQAPTAASEGITLADVGFATPESVLHDEQADVYLVTNISGSPVDKDGDGFISRVNPDGSIEDLKWIDGATGGFELNAPKGMALVGDSLYVADIDCVRVFHRTTGASEGEICFPGATFLNDVAVDANGTLYVTDSGLTGPALEPSGTDAVYRFTSDGRRAALAEGDELGGPNGIAFGPRGGFVVSFGSGAIYQLAPDGSQNTVLPASEERQLDGIVFTPDGGFLFSSWGNQSVYRVGVDGTMAAIVENVAAPADIGFDAQRNRVLIPLFLADEVWIIDIN